MEIVEIIFDYNEDEVNIIKDDGSIKHIIRHDIVGQINKTRQLVEDILNSIDFRNPSAGVILLCINEDEKTIIGEW